MLTARFFIFSNIEHRTSNIEHRTSNIEHRTSNIEPRTSNLEPRTYLMVTNSSEPVGCSATTASKSALVAPIFIATAKP